MVFIEIINAMTIYYGKTDCIYTYYSKGKDIKKLGKIF
jgi:hypothetical protein